MKSSFILDPFYDEKIINASKNIKDKTFVFFTIICLLKAFLC